MFNFFAQEGSRQGNSFIISGGDFNHIKNVLRMKEGDTFLVSCEGQSHLCSLTAFYGDSILAEIIEENYNKTELPVKMYLFKGFPRAIKWSLLYKRL